MTLGNMITAIREDLGFTQAEMAAALSISDGYMSQLEGGKRNAKLQYKDGVYWDLAKLATHASPKECWHLYLVLVGLDMEWRDPMIYEVLGRHFYQRFLEEEKEVRQMDRRKTKARNRRARSYRHASNF